MGVSVTGSVVTQPRRAIPLEELLAVLHRLSDDREQVDAFVRFLSRRILARRRAQAPLPPRPGAVQAARARLPRRGN